MSSYLAAPLSVTNECKCTIEADEKEGLAQINKWSEEIDGKFEAADEAMARLEIWLVKAEQAEKFVMQDEQFKYEFKLHEKKLEMQAQLAKQSNNKTNAKECEVFTNKPSAKLLKLVISKFDGSFMHWPKFWG